MNGNIAQYIERERNSQHNRTPLNRENSGKFSVQSVSVRLPSFFRLFLAKAGGSSTSLSGGGEPNVSSASEATPTNANSATNIKPAATMSRRVRVDRIRDSLKDNQVSFDRLLRLAAETYKLDPGLLKLTYELPDTGEVSLLLSDEDVADALLFMGGGAVDVTCHPTPRFSVGPSFLRLNLLVSSTSTTSTSDNSNDITTVVRLIDVERILDDESHQPSLEKLALVGRESTSPTTKNNSKPNNGNNDWKFVYLRPSDGSTFWLATDRDLQDTLVANQHQQEMGIHAVRSEAQLTQLTAAMRRHSTNNHQGNADHHAVDAALLLRGDNGEENGQKNPGAPTSAKPNNRNLNNHDTFGDLNLTQASLDLDPVFQVSASDGMGLDNNNNNNNANSFEVERLQTLEQTVLEQATWMRQQHERVETLEQTVQEAVDELHEKLHELQSSPMPSELEETARQAAEEVNDERIEELEQDLEEFKIRMGNIQKQVSKQEVLMVKKLDDLKGLLVDASQQDRMKEMETALAKQKTQVNDLVMSFVMRLKQLESSMASLKQQSTGESSSSAAEVAQVSGSSTAYASPTPADRARATVPQSASLAPLQADKKNRLYLLPEASTRTGVGCELGTAKQTSHISIRAINNVLSWDLKEQLTPGMYRAVLPICRGDPGGASIHVGIVSTAKEGVDLKLANKLRAGLPLVQFTPTESWEIYTKVTTDLIEVKGEPGEVFVIVSGGWYCDVRAVSLEYAGSLHEKRTEINEKSEEKTSAAAGTGAPSSPRTTPSYLSSANRSTSAQRGASSPLRPRMSDSTANKQKNGNSNTSSSSEPKGASPLRSPASPRSYSSPLRARSGANGDETANRPLADFSPSRKPSPFKTRLGSGYSTPLRSTQPTTAASNNKDKDSNGNKNAIKPTRNGSSSSNNSRSSFSQDNDSVVEFKK